MRKYFWIALLAASVAVYMAVPGISQTKRADPWVLDLVDAFNKNFDRLSALTCSGPVPTRFAPGDTLNAKILNANFKVIVDALEQGKCDKGTR